MFKTIPQIYVLWLILEWSVVRWQDCTLWQSFGFSVSLWGFANVCNVCGVSFFFFCGGRKNKINSIKFALSCQKAKSFLFSIYHYRICMVVCLFTLVANGSQI
jgi:hypothetical protein